MAPVQAALPGSPPTRPSPAGSWSLTPPPQGSPNGAPAMAMPSPPTAPTRASPSGSFAMAAPPAAGADGRWLHRRRRRATRPRARGAPWPRPRGQRHAVSIKHDGAAPPDARVAVELLDRRSARFRASGPGARLNSARGGAERTLEKVTVLQAQGSGILVKGRNDAQRVVPSVTELNKDAADARLQSVLRDDGQN